MCCYVLLSEPGSKYLAHVAPASSKSEPVADCMIRKLTDMGILSGIQVVGCDSTNANTGFKGGVIQYIEKAVGHPLQWFICILHTNELPLRHQKVPPLGRPRHQEKFGQPYSLANHCQLYHFNLLQMVTVFLIFQQLSCRASAETKSTCTKLFKLLDKDVFLMIWQDRNQDQ